MTSPAGDGLLTVQELADQWKLSPETLYSWRGLNKGPKSFKLGRRVVYRESDVQAWRTEQEQSTARGEERRAS